MVAYFEKEPKNWTDLTRVDLIRFFWTIDSVLGPKIENRLRSIQFWICYKTEPCTPLPNTIVLEVAKQSVGRPTNENRQPPPRLPQSYQQDMPTYQTTKLNLTKNKSKKGTPHSCCSQPRRHGRRRRLASLTPIKHSIYSIQNKLKTIKREIKIDQIIIHVWHSF